MKQEMTPIISIPDRILKAALAWPDLPAILTAEKIISYKMLAHGILSAQERLAQLGLPKGQLLAIEVTDPARHLILALAAMRLGVPTVSLSRGSSGAKDLRCVAVLADDVDPTHDSPVFVIDPSWFAGQPASGIWVEASPATLCRVSYTSGSTGDAKPTAMTQTTLWNRIESRLAASVSHAGRTLVLPTLTTNFGFTRSIMPLVQGEAIVFAQQYEDAVRLIELYSVESLVGSPSQLVAVLETLDTCPSSTASLRMVKSGGGPLWGSLIEKLRQKLCSNIVDVYSSTEGGPAGVAAGHLLAKRSECLSFLPITQIRCIASPESESEGVGAIEIFSQSRAVAYMPAQPFVAPEPGWVRTGDLGRISEDGELQLLGRDGHILNAGGRKFNSEMMQEFLIAQTGIHDAGIVTSGEESHGTEVWLALACEDTLDITAICARMSEAFNGFAPDRIVRFARLPRTTLGKLETATLRNMISQTLR